jgi:penicillin-binding protein 1A
MKKSPPAERRRPHRPASRWRWWRVVLMRVLIGGALMGLVTVAVVLAVYAQLAKRYDLTQLGKMPERTVVLDAKGEVLGRMHGENRIVVPLNEVSPWFVKALLAREDSRFYDHHGVDYVGVLRAMVRNLKEGRVVQGASTITMQLARNSYPDLNERSFHRKLLEIMLARRIEKAWTKDQILEHYVNRIFFGTNLYGIQRASQVYFGKHASQLTLGEGALIAGIIRGPVKFSPFKNLQSAEKERDDVLKRMVKLKMITQEEALQGKYQEIVLRAQPIFQSQGGYALDAIRRDLDMILEEHEIEDGGLLVYTTLSKALQDAAEQSVEKRLEDVEKLKGYHHTTKAAFDASWNVTQEVPSTPYVQGAVAVLDNATGGILALVGGRDYRQSKYNRATQGERQIGSTVKPFVYAAGITRGFLPGSFVDDAPLQPGEIEGAGAGWNPQNSDGKFLGQQPLTTGLVQSRNLMTIRVGNYAGIDRVRQILSDAGIGNSAERTPQIFIGNLGGNPKDLTSAFSIFPNDGIRRRPFLIDKITDKAGNILYATNVLEVEVVTPGVAFLMRRLLGQVMDHGTAASVRSTYKFKEPGGGKTGTTNDYKDAWFAGYTDRVTCGVWVGLDKPDTIIAGGYGAKLAIPIWVDCVKKAVDLGYVPAGPRVEPPTTQVALCRASSLLASPACQAAGTAYGDELPYELVPESFCPGDHAGVYPAVGYDQPRRRPPSPVNIFNRIRSWFR